MSKSYSDPELLNLLRRAWEQQQTREAEQAAARAQREADDAAARQAEQTAQLAALLTEWRFPCVPTGPTISIGDATFRHCWRYQTAGVEVLRPCPGCGDLQAIGDTSYPGYLYPLLTQDVLPCWACHEAELDRQAAERDAAPAPTAAAPPTLAEQLDTLIRAIVREELGGPA